MKASELYNNFKLLQLEIYNATCVWK